MKRNVRQMGSALAAIVFVVMAGSAEAAQPSTDKPLGLPQDWSNHMVVYTHVLTPQEAQQQGPKAMKRWLRDAKDPRFLVALTRRLNAEDSAQAQSMALPPKNHPLWWKPAPTGLARDWNASLGSIGGTGTPDVYPAKYSFNINATPSCANDFVVYTTANPGTRSQWTGTFTGSAGNTSLTVNGTTLTANTSFGYPTYIPVDFLESGSNSAEATSLAAGVNGEVSATGVSASASGSTVTFTYPSGTVPTAPTEALNNYTQTAVTTTSHADATLVAYNNLYKTTCSTGTVPSVFFAYNTGSGATTRTSPVLSYYDGGKQVAFVQSNSSNVAQLVLLKWSSASPAGTPSSPITPATAASATAYRNCTAPCMYIMTFSNNADDLHSSPFVGYYDDTLWVGDTKGALHKFTGVFFGTPAEVTTGGFPATVSTGNELSPPVYDVIAKQAYVGSAFSGTTGGTFSRVDGTTGTVYSSPALTTVTTASTGVLASPLLDSGNARVYAFLFSDGSVGDGTNCTTFTGAPNGCRSIIQFTTGFAAGSTGNTKAFVGRGNNSPVLVFNEGTFDDAYYSSANGTGALYICGGEPGNTYYTTMWKVPITANVMGTPVEGMELGYHDDTTDRTGDCSTVTEVKNGSNEYLFVSVTGFGFQTAASGACGGDSTAGSCIYMINLANLNGSNGTTWATSNTARAGFAVPGGTGGIVVDNVSSASGASQVYFAGLAAVPTGSAYNTAYQLSQSGLQ